MKNDPDLYSSNYCHCEGAGYAEVSSAPILNSIKMGFCFHELELRTQTDGKSISAVASLNNEGVET